MNSLVLLLSILPQYSFDRDAELVELQVDCAGDNERDLSAPEICTTEN